MKENRRGKLLPRIILLAVVAAAIVAIRATGASAWLEPERLQALMAGYGMLAPLVYMGIYALAPALFLPGLPLTILGGILFGPLWGVVYAITGATVGATVAFLVARYLGRDWVTNKLRGTKMEQLDQEVERHGWKVVAVTRLIPLFPFNLLNYAFGLTRIGLAPYVAATFVCMLPACIAFIVFSSSLLDVMRGRISPAFIIGLLLVAGVSLIPVYFKRRTPKKTQTRPSGT